MLLSEKFFPYENSQVSEQHGCLISLLTSFGLISSLVVEKNSQMRAKAEIKGLMDVY